MRKEVPRVLKTDGVQGLGRLALSVFMHEPCVALNVSGTKIMLFINRKKLFLPRLPFLDCPALTIQSLSLLMT